MKRKLKISELFKIGLPIVIGSLFFYNCSQSVTPPLDDNIKKGDPDPIINSISPTEGLAGITEFTITGENFSSIADENFVYFNSSPAMVLSATETQLKIIPPNIIQDSVSVKINTTAASFSNVVKVNLVSAIREVYPFADYQKPYAITSDKEGNIYFSLSGEGVKKITPQGELIDFAPKGGESFYSGLQYGPGGKLYGIRGLRAVFLIEENAAPVPYSVFDNGTSMFALDFDKDHNLWVAGKGGKIYRVPSNAESNSDWKSFEFEPEVSSLKIYNDHIYLAAKANGSVNIYSIEILADNVGTPEIYFQFSTNFDPLLSVNTITFAADGQLFLGTDDLDPVKFVNSDGSFGIWYEGVISPEIYDFSWGPGNELFVARAAYSGNGIETNQTIQAINMEKSGAPQYGRE